ncbi:PEP-CTERM sorting domain-containing protein [Jeongeupia naejangsanensis]|uniref:PEP-CTERM sorting domain-containing protein n=1 Tax=Jeongeupia naejangsanensis TaxID=613195 RepID=A0ABS2BHR8_9NEIS|nr:PEP-CTERM sorting domain-containing protein [Jeongeupia naejangsanensis]MBM3115152.1 PEP-CTERM sorting domain-containing protein [Jeongeupia naejangsanensis]
MDGLKAVAAVTMFLAAGLSHAAFSKTYDIGAAPLSAQDTFTVTGPSRLTFDLTPVSATGSLANLFAVNYQLAPIGQLLGLQQLIFNPGTRSYSGSFNLPTAGTYSSFFAVTKDANWLGTLKLNVAPVPEPETYALMGAGLLGVLLSRRRKQRSTAALAV